MRFRHIIEQVYFRPWYITRAGHASIQMLLQSRLAQPIQPQQSQEDLIRELGDFMGPPRRAYHVDSDRIAHVYILGPLGKGLSNMEKVCGATGYEDLTKEISQAFESARGLMLHIDSPGGAVVGCAEVAALVGSATIPTLAYTEDEACSAAYKIAVGCDEVVSTPSAALGSIGTIIPWVDFSGELELLGLKPEPIVNKGADIKAIGHAGSLTEQQREFLQDFVDRSGAQFHAHVARFRDVDPDALNGGFFESAKALELNLIDAIVPDREAARQRLLAKLR